MEFRGALASTVTFRQPARGSGTAQFPLKIGSQTGWFGIAALDYLPPNVRIELAALTPGTDVTAWVIPRTCADEDGLDVWALRVNEQSLISFAATASAVEHRARRGIPVWITAAVLGMASLAVHRGLTARVKR